MIYSNSIKTVVINRIESISGRVNDFPLSHRMGEGRGEGFLNSFCS